MEDEAPRPNCVLEVSSCFCERCSKKIEKRFSKIRGVISVVAEAKKKWVHIAGTADLGKLLHAIEKKGRKVQVIYYCKMMNLSNYQPTKQEDTHDDKTTKHGPQKHYSTSSTSSTESMEKNSFPIRRKQVDEEAEDHFACGDNSDDNNGNDEEYGDAHAKYKSRVHKRESHSAAAAAAPRVARPPSPPWPKPHARGFGDDFMDADVAHHLRKMRSTVPQPMSHSGYMHVQPPPPPQYGGYYGGGSSYTAAYEAAPPRAYQYGYSPYYHG